MIDIFAFILVGALALYFHWLSLKLERKVDKVEHYNHLLLAQLREYESEIIRLNNKLAGGSDDV